MNEAAPDPSCRVCGSRAHDTGNPCGGASAEPGGAAPDKRVEWVRETCAKAAEQAYMPGTDPNGEWQRACRNAAAAIRALDFGGGGAPAAGEREALERARSLLHDWIDEHGEPRFFEGEDEQDAAFNDLEARIAAALRAPAPPTHRESPS